MKHIKTILNSPYFFWLILTLPSIGMINGALNGRDLEELLHPTGEFAARFMIIAMMLTPLRMLFPGARWTAWLMQRRRYLGVAAFGYAALHTLYYVIDLGTLSLVLQDAVRFGIWTGWVAFLIFVPLAMTSNSVSVRTMGKGWGNLQRLVYVAAVATLLHWIFIHNTFGGALVHFLPLVGLEIYRIWKVSSGRKGSEPGQSMA
ncbi:protein-methionine-sulfoxide reductase heme-binding subunit MsrQ [Pyruvatibacter sp.]